LQSSAHNKEEHKPTDTCLKDKKMCVKNEMLPDGDLLLAVAGGDSDEETAEYRW
jgi:structure-specific recognition protein 1